MKKINVILVLLFCIFGILGCQKSIPKIENDIESCEQLYGTWTQTRLTEGAIHAEEDPTIVLGIATFNTFTKVVFDENQKMQTTISYKLESYESIDEEIPVSMEELQEYFSQVMTIESKFVASSDQLQYENELVIIDDSPILYDEFILMTPNASPKIETVSWKIEDNKLFLTTKLGEEVIESVYYKK